MLKGVYDWKGYELRLIDDYENVYEPDYDVQALDIDEEIGQFQSLAFVKNKEYKEDGVNGAGVDTSYLNSTRNLSIAHSKVNEDEIQL